MTIFKKLFLLSAIFSIPNIAFAYNNLPSDNTLSPFPDIVSLRKDCSSSNQLLNNCANNMTEMLNWVWSIRQPNKLSPLRIDIGTGTFNVPADRFFCDDRGSLTIRGSGPDNTILTAGGFNELGNSPVVAIQNCVDITFENLTIRSDQWTGSSGSKVGVLWADGGNSTWNNVTIQSATYGWYDTFQNCNAPGEHYWFGSKIHTRTAGSDTVAYVTACGDSWFFGGELKAIVDGYSYRVAAGVYATAASESIVGNIQIFGSTIRVLTEGDGSVFRGGEGYNGLRARAGSSIHMHGGIIAVRADLGNQNQDVNGVFVADSSSKIHTPETAFTVIAGGNGTAYRVKGKAQSPYQWPANTTLPNITSVTGSDTFVETDCSPTGCQTIGNEPHMLIYSEACQVNGEPWFDMVTRECR